MFNAQRFRIWAVRHREQLTGALTSLFAYAFMWAAGSRIVDAIFIDWMGLNLKTHPARVIVAVILFWNIFPAVSGAMEARKMRQQRIAAERASGQS